MYDKENITVPYNEKDPFQVQCKCPLQLASLKDWLKKEHITALELAFRLGKPKRAVTIVTVTKGKDACCD